MCNILTFPIWSHHDSIQEQFISPGSIQSPVCLICWLCTAHCISALAMCVYNTYTEHSWSSLCKLFKKTGQRMSAPAQGINILFCFYLPESSLLHLTARLTIKWQILHNGWCPYIQLIKVSFREKGSHTESFCCCLCTFSVIYGNISLCGSFLMAFLICCHAEYNGEEKTEISIFSFLPEGIDEYIWIIISTAMTHGK